MQRTKKTFPLAAAALLALGCSGGSSPGEFFGGTGATYRQVQDTIFTPSCATSDCHQGVDAPYGLDLRSGEALTNTVGLPSGERPEFDRIEPGNATDSYLYMKVAGDARIFGDRMPAFAPPLTDEKLLLLRDWIEQGANP
jgi:hypothetical protein